ncbi:hypothetical protein EUX98_g9483 [Antrodiella citrinella]|uniref:RRM domain-containing protein n=1 Tax=Antrodiella citrinella TaxID=2447956 RepID=A0A4S4LU86_9APHY|nr:hypothetical protein EUX98_g9483 [Antrodiella citrinella]
MASPTTYAVQTTEQNLVDFFTFCGKISSVKYDDAEHSAIVHFEKPQAAKTALMLNGGTLDGAHLSVTSETTHPDHDGSADNDHEHLDQTDKPRAGIAAEYLARGYKLSDHILERAIALDNEKGISQKFLAYIQSMDTTLGEKALGKDKTISGKVQEALGQATAQARSLDEVKGVSKSAGDYYSKALASPLGQSVFSFYTTTSKQILDIHEEARRIADTHKAAAAHAAAAGEKRETPASTAVGSSAPPLDPAVDAPKLQ